MHGKRKKLRKKLLLLLISLVILLICLVCVGYVAITETKTNSHNSETTEDAGPQDGQIKVACIGDSITYGAGVTDWKTDNYPTVLQNILGDGYYVANFGFCGACVNPKGDRPYIEQEVYQQSLDFDADIIVIMLGTNDAKGRNWVDTYSFMRAYLALIESYFENGRQPKVYIGLCAEGYSNPDPENIYQIQPVIIDKIVETIKITYIENAELIDIHSVTESHPEWYIKDGIHPNSDGAKAIAEVVAEAITKQ